MLAFILVTALVIVFVRFLSSIKQFERIFVFSKTIPGPPIKELITNAKRECKLKKVCQLLFRLHIIYQSKGLNRCFLISVILPWLKQLRERYGTVFCIWFGKDLTVFFTDPVDVKQILGDNTLLFKSKNYKLMEDWLGKGLLTSGGESWHRRRKMLTPSFHFKILSEFRTPMLHYCDALVNQLIPLADGKEIDIYPFITLFALDVICETAMGIQKHALSNSDSEYVKAVQT